MQANRWRRSSPGLFLPLHLPLSLSVQRKSSSSHTLAILIGSLGSRNFSKILISSKIASAHAQIPLLSRLFPFTCTFQSLFLYSAFLPRSRRRLYFQIGTICETSLQQRQQGSSSSLLSSIHSLGLAFVLVTTLLRSGLGD